MKKWMASLGVLASLFYAFSSATAAGATTGANAAAAAHIRSFESTSLIKTDGTYWTWGGNQSVPTQVEGISNAADSFGDIQESDLFVVKQDRSVLFLSQDNPSSRIKAEPFEGLKDLVDVRRIRNTIAALDAGGKVFSAEINDGANRLGSFIPVTGLDNVSMMDNYYEIILPNYDYIPRWLFLKTDGTVWTNQDEKLQSFVPVQYLQDITSVSGNLALKKDGTVWTLPEQLTRQNGPGAELSARKLDSLSNIKMIKAAGNARLAVDGQARLWFWGATVTGFSDGTTYHNQDSPVLLTKVKDVKDAFVVERSLIVLTQAGQVFETSLQLEKLPGSADFKLVSTNVDKIKAGGRHIIMQKKDGSLWGWGVNKNGKLGSGDYEFMHAAPVPVQKPVSVHVNGDWIPLNNGVITRDGQSFVPLRSVFEQLGARITFDETSKTATIERTKTGSEKITIRIDFKTSETWLSGKIVKLSQKPFSVNGVSYLPLRLISESLGAKVEWNAQSDDISITLAK
ncbi:stalk domain-containing protein [Paenibacillus caui]|uniref:stalk domain-containing protein n=1 Tax=Paenibacillus caui TaxID=2873927 RepID=UPI001CAA1ABA|nr:stalk domain-containing protein [Paenibacillus caui]